ncbi:MAG TPA: hypothetical protein VEA41_09085 [Salinarimonas sp.]|nr:hypothetical protein [Salinarimonas sp.]
MSNTIVRLAEYRDDYLVSQLVMGLRAAVRSESDPEYARRILARVSHEVRRRGHVGMAALIEHVAGTTN